MHTYGGAHAEDTSTLITQVSSFFFFFETDSITSLELVKQIWLSFEHETQSLNTGGLGSGKTVRKIPLPPSFAGWLEAKISDGLAKAGVGTGKALHTWKQRWCSCGQGADRCSMSRADSLEHYIRGRVPGALQAEDRLTMVEPSHRPVPASGLCEPMEGQGLHKRIIVHYLSGSKKSLKACKTHTGK